MLKTRIEDPVNGKIEGVFTKVRGWIVSNEIIGSVHLKLGEETYPVKHTLRNDVKKVFPDMHGSGFEYMMDFRGVSEAQIASMGGKLELLVKGKVFPVADIDIDRLQESACAWRSAKDLKLARIAALTACSRCGAALRFPERPAAFFCDACGTRYVRGSHSVDFLTEDLREEFRLMETENVSAHPYPNQARSLINEIAAKDGLVLDVGAGDQKELHPSVICAEIVAYPATDVLSVGQRLPFLDASFDAVYSNAVLEHVTDPFACADEMLRVLKPGGLVFCSVPFLQPEHGYPAHYYNMTQDGLTNLFERRGAVTLRKEVPNWGHPLYAGQWFMSSYLRYLPETHRQKLEQLTIKEFLGLKRAPTEELFSALSGEGRRILACATFAVLQKPES